MRLASKSDIRLLPGKNLMTKFSVAKKLLKNKNLAFKNELKTGTVQYEPKIQRYTFLLQRNF